MDHKKLISYILLGNTLAAKEFIKRSQERGYKLNPIVGNANNPLFQLVVRYRQTAIALDFIAQGVEVNTQDKWGITPLHEAAETGNIILVEKLLAKGANPFTCNVHGITAGILAARNGHAELAYRLSPSFLSNYPNLIYLSNAPSQSSENQDEPLDLSKTGPNAINVKLSFFKPNKPSRLVPVEKVMVEIDPEYVFEVKRLTF
ncbi:ankyrin repeat domain-containing protein [Rickettsiella massiliensis]|uniref:ankyrin repeat domain-containing protein n=1 Tax=Rickettsiella massiliensis TaxID=676517 RepID=UPI00178C3A69|nr:ankyrin repeat domain-containing protein [Rickettsiella massiliensis]